MNTLFIHLGLLSLGVIFWLYYRHWLSKLAFRRALKDVDTFEDMYQRGVRDYPGNVEPSLRSVNVLLAVCGVLTVLYGFNAIVLLNGVFNNPIGITPLIDFITALAYSLSIIYIVRIGLRVERQQYSAYVTYRDKQEKRKARKQEKIANEAEWRRFKSHRRIYVNKYTP